MHSHRRIALALALLLPTFATSPAISACVTSTHTASYKTVTSNAAVFDTVLYSDYSDWYSETHVDAAHDTLHLESSCMTSLSASSSVTHLYTLAGVPAGTPVPVIVRMRMKGNVGSSNECSVAEASGSLSLNSVPAVFCTLYRWAYNSMCPPAPGTAFDSTLTASANIPAGQPFPVTFRLTDSAYQLRANNSASLRFTLPAGVSLVSCTGETMTNVTYVAGVDALAGGGTRIEQLWPNPARGLAHARVSVDAGVRASLSLYDLAGRAIETQAWTPAATGERTLTLGERAPLAPGTYFVRLAQGRSRLTRALVVLK